MNGSDNLSYLDIPTATVIPFTTLTTPTAPTVVNNGTTDVTSGTTFLHLTYRITANSSVGETAASSVNNSPTGLAINLDRDQWDPTKNSVKLTWSAVPSAVSYNVYMGTVAGSEYLIASGVAGLTFVDDGSFAQDVTRLYPTTNSTAGPRTTRGTNINGRAFMAGDADNPYYVWWGGDFGFELDFTPANGGGNQAIGSGDKNIPVKVTLHRDGKGTPAIKVYCTGTYGKRYTMTPDQVTINNQIISFYDVTEDEGESGTTAPDAVIHYNNSEWYPATDGFKTDGTQPQIQNVLTTKRTTNTIIPDLDLLNQSAMSGAVGLGFNGRLYYALPVSQASNNEIWVLDLDRKGAWMKPWSIAADWMLLYGDNNGNTHHLVLSGNRIYSLSYSALTTDNGTPFITSGQSGEIYFSPDKRMWVQLLQIVIVLARPQGKMNWQVTGKTEDDDLASLGDPTIFTAEMNSTVTGWGEVNRYISGWGRNRWSKVRLVPTDSSSDPQEIAIEIDETVQRFSYAWDTSTAGVDYGISDIIAEYIEVGVLDLS